MGKLKSTNASISIGNKLKRNAKRTKCPAFIEDIETLQAQHQCLSSYKLRVKTFAQRLMSTTLL